MSDMTYWALVPAAGAGARMQTQTAKQYLPLFGKTVLDHTLTRLTNYPRFEKVMVAISQDDDVWPTTSWAAHSKIMSTVGGNSRAHSVLNGLIALQTLANPNDWVLVHDAARPCVTHADVDALIEKVGSDAVGGLLGAPVRDTMKRTQQYHRIIKTEERTHLWHAFTPQMFRFSVLLKALKEAIEKNHAVTDEASAGSR
jgi:2-C-methyl-D-erythritol 4-phosphate cytidylyltransferase